MSFPKFLAPVLGLCIAFLVSAGCKDSTPSKTGSDKTGDAKLQSKDPEENADGWLFNDGNEPEKYHLLLKIDLAKKEASVKFLDDKAKDEVLLAAESITLTIKNGKPIPIELKAQRPKDKNKTSIFVGTGERLGSKVDPLKVEINTEISKEPFIFRLDVEHQKKGK